MDEAVGYSSPETDPNWPTPHPSMQVVHAWMLWRSGRLEAAEEAFVRLQGPVNAYSVKVRRRFFMYRANMRTCLGLFDEAKGDLDNAFDPQGASAFYLYCLTDYYRRSQNLDMADQVFRELKDEHPESFHISQLRETEPSI